MDDMEAHIKNVKELSNLRDDILQQQMTDFKKETKQEFQRLDKKIDGINENFNKQFEGLEDKMVETIVKTLNTRNNQRIIRTLKWGTGVSLGALAIFFKDKILSFFTTLFGG